MSSTVIITGVGKRLGYRLALHMLNRGDNVIGTYRTDYTQLEVLRDKGAQLYQIDFYQQQQLDEFISHLQANLKSLRAIIHNASDWLPDPKSSPTNEGDAHQVLSKMMTIHASVPYQLNLALKDKFCTSLDPMGDVIHISDFVAEKGSKKHVAYAASKAALNNMTLSFSAMLAPKVKVNTISPALLHFNEWDDDDYKAKALAKALLPREAGFDEVINAVDFLMNSEYMTGREIKLDGGRHLK